MDQPVTRPKFKVGDRVWYARNMDYFMGKLEIGDAGTVRAIDKDFYGVEFDRYVEGHDLGGVCKQGHGFWMLRKELSTLEEEPEYPLQPPNLELIF